MPIQHAYVSAATVFPWLDGRAVSSLDGGEAGAYRFDTRSYKRHLPMSSNVVPTAELDQLCVCPGQFATQSLASFVIGQQILLCPVRRIDVSIRYHIISWHELSRPIRS